MVDSIQAYQVGFRRTDLEISTHVIFYTGDTKTKSYSY